MKKDKYKARLLKLFRKKVKEEDVPADFDDYFSDRVAEGELKREGNGKNTTYYRLK